LLLSPAFVGAFDQTRTVAPPSRRIDLLSTYRYVRAAIMILVVMLAASIVVQHHHDPSGCWEHSISAYYYTPARGVLVAQLVAVGVCVIAIKGSSEVEDILLNLAGMLAPVIAFVPSRTNGLCPSTSATVEEKAAAVANNMTALFVAGFVALTVVLVSAVVASRRARIGRGREVGMALSWVLYLATLGWFAFDRSGFESVAHYVAAAMFFVFVIGVVVANAVNYAEDHPSRYRLFVPVNRYTVLAGAMIVSPTVLWLVSLAVSWQHAPFFIEGVLIGLFAVFWLAQSTELWSRSAAVEPG
jgi:hypothetical protein